MQTTLMPNRQLCEDAGISYVALAAFPGEGLSMRSEDGVCALSWLHVLRELCP